MQNKSLFTQGFLKFAHLPTAILIIGYPVYWLELYFFNKGQGRASLLAAAIFSFAATVIIIKAGKALFVLYKWLKTNWAKQDFLIKWYIVAGGIIITGMLIIIFYASLLPPHLSQELDALNYHLTIPKQHLILKSFTHIKWSSADLFSMPIDFALAPYWLATKLPNKFPQFLFLLGLILVSTSLTRRFSGSNFMSICLVIFAIFGSHFIGIQMGTAMIDIVIAYLFIAALDSFLNKNIPLAAVEFSFFLWSKSFIPLQVIFIVIFAVISWKLFKITGVKEITWGFSGIITPDARQEYMVNLKKTLLPLALLTFVIAGPFLVKSTYYSGTPLFPFAPGIISINKNIDQGKNRQSSVLISSRAHISAKDAYGHGRSLTAFLKHFWLIAIPEKEVNNSYDYPVGLAYLLFLGPFLYMFFYSIKKGQFSILAVVTTIYWLSWWFGSQQTRFLYIPVVLMMIIVSSEIKIQSSIFTAAVVISLVFTSLSVFGAHKNDFGKSLIAALRGKDREIIKLNEYYLAQGKTDPVYLDYFDIAYACFPVTVINNNSRWVLKSDQ